MSCFVSAFADSTWGWGERRSLHVQMRSLEANYSRVQGKLQELHPGSKYFLVCPLASATLRSDADTCVTCSGPVSERVVQAAGEIAAGLGGIDKKVQLEAPPTQSSPETAAPPESPQPAPRIGAAKVVPRRGRGRAIPGFTARIRR